MKLYHYTDFAAFDGILRDRELRVNNVLNMNDASEMDLFMSGIFTAVKKRFSDDEKDKVQMLKLMLDEVRKQYYQYSVYAACFSSYRDDAAQWERYGARGKGVCLCVQKDVLEKMTGGAIFLQKVFYQEDMDSHPLVEKIYNLLIEDPEFRESPELMEAYYEARRICGSFKHPSFSSERETRLVVMPFEVDDFNLKPRYHVSRERIKKYYPLDLDEMCAQAGKTIEDLVTEVIVGPESTQSIPILQDYLADLGLHKLAGSISRSDCPLRSKI